MKTFSLSSQRRLKSQRSIEGLFAPGCGAASAIAYPLRAVWKTTQWRPEGDCGEDRIMVSVPKKRLRKAVHRVRIRRLVREAYRLNRGELAREGREPADIAFVWVADELRDFASVTKAMRRLLSAINRDDSASGPT